MKKKLLFVLFMSLFPLVKMESNEVLNVNATDEYSLNPIAKYTFNESNLALDDMGNFNLSVQGSPTATENGVYLNGSSYLYYAPQTNEDFTDNLDALTITCWAKEDTVANKHRFMIGTGVAYSTLGLGMGFYETNSAYIVPIGGSDGYANNFVTSQHDTFGTKVPSYEISTNWNLYTLVLTNGTSYFGVNGHLYPININVDMSKIANTSQTFTIGGVCNNNGSVFYNGFKGEIADVRIFNSTISEQEFSTMYSNGIKGSNNITRNVQIDSITNSLNTDVDFEVEASKLTKSEIMTSLASVKPIVKLSDNSEVETSVIYSDISINNTYAMATGLITLANVAGSKKITVKINKGGWSSISLNTSFTDHMVLQRNKKVKIFGYGGDVGNTITVSFNGQTKVGTITENGWEVYLDPMDANSTGQKLTITYASQTIELNDVVVGEVLLCSGQSNMAVTVQYIYNKDKKVKLDYLTYDNYEKIRVLDIPVSSASEPKVYDKSAAKWTVCETLDNAMAYSAYAMAVASNYQALLKDVVVGVITASVGGSCIEEWLDPTSLTTLNSYAASMQKVDSQYYNAMIYNLKGYTLSGILWYQGEANSQPRMVNDYIKQFKAYVNHYRELFEDEDLPIFVQQLVQFDNWVETAYIRQAQWNFMNTFDNVYTICGIDTGSMEPSDGIHPTDKFVLGGRVAGALAMHYGITKENYNVDLPYGISKVITSAELTKENNLYKITLKTNAKDINADGVVTGFEVRRTNSVKWNYVDAEVVNNEIVILTDITNICEIRYNFTNGYSLDEASYAFKCKGNFIYDDQNLPIVPLESLLINNTIDEKQETSDLPSEEESEEPSEEQSEEPTISSEEESEGKYKETAYDPNFSYEEPEYSSDIGGTVTKKGCNGQVVGSMISLLSLLGLCFSRKRK